uniref:Tail fiber protein n=1 Tax=Caulobacter phage BL57 TaxID=3348355 RepID=A0AB74UKE4_9VIRU
MAINSTELIDRLIKLVAFGVTKTGKASDKSGSNESIPSPTVVFPENIWNEKALLPALPPAADTAQVKVYAGAARIRATADPTAQPNETWLATSTYGTPSTRLTNFIAPSVGGSGYAARVFIGDPNTGPAARIFPDTTGEEWTFDYIAGVLNFPTAVPGPRPPRSVRARSASPPTASISNSTATSGRPAAAEAGSTPTAWEPWRTRMPMTSTSPAAKSPTSSSPTSPSTVEPSNPQEPNPWPRSSTTPCCTIWSTATSPLTPTPSR